MACCVVHYSSKFSCSCRHYAVMCSVWRGLSIILYTVFTYLCELVLAYKKREVRIGVTSDVLLHSCSDHLCLKNVFCISAVLSQKPVLRLNHTVISDLTIWCYFLPPSSWRLRKPHSFVYRASEEAWCLVPLVTASEIHAAYTPRCSLKTETWRRRAGWTASAWAQGGGARTGAASPCWTRPRSSSRPATWRAKASSAAQTWGLEIRLCVLFKCVCQLELGWRDSS